MLGWGWVELGILKDFKHGYTICCSKQWIQIVVDWEGCMRMWFELVILNMGGEWWVCSKRVLGVKNVVTYCIELMVEHIQNITY